jgi:group I intron endonuclease
LIAISGVYKITNLSNGKVYIGQSKNVHKRWKGHLKFAEKSKYPLYSAMRKYGTNSFVFEILKETYDLDRWEQFFIFWYESFSNPEKGYNLTPGGKILRLRVPYQKAKSPDWVNPMIGRKYSEEHRRKLSLSHMGKPNPGMAKPVRRLDSGEEYPSCREAWRRTGFHYQMIAGIADGSHLPKGWPLWEWVRA